MPLQRAGFLVLSLLCVASFGCNRPSELNEDHSACILPYRGGQWLAWNQADRDRWVSAYIDGYEFGVHDACNATDGLLDFKGNRIPEHDPDEIPLPSGVCRKVAPHYSKFKPIADRESDVSAYTGVLSSFYTAHPEYQDIPYEYLMQYLTDEENKNADDLYKMAKTGEMRTHW